MNPTARFNARRRQIRLLTLALVAVVAAGAAAGGEAAGQSGAASDELRRRIEEHFDVLTIANGVALRPKSPRNDVRWIEVTDGTINVNGAPATGVELRERLGEDAASVMQLSYLEPAARAALFPGRSGPDPIERPDAVREPPRRSRGGRGAFRLGGNIVVAADETIGGDAVAIGGLVRVLGEVRGDVVAVGGGVELGPQANVHGDVTAVGGALTRDPTARVGGEVVEIGTGSFAFNRRNWTGPLSGIWWGSWLGAAFALMATVIRVAVLCLLAVLTVLLARQHVDRVSQLAAREPVKAGAIGLLAQVLFVPLLVVTILVLVVTIIGIPLLVLIPFALLGLGVVALVGYTAIAQRVGRLVGGRVTWLGQGPYAATLGGILLLSAPLLIARLVGLAGGPVFPMTFGLSLIGTAIEYPGVDDRVRRRRPDALRYQDDSAERGRTLNVPMLWTPSTGCPAASRRRAPAQCVIA